MKRWAKRFRTLVHPDAAERELDEELRFHLAMEEKRHLEAGLSPAEARRRAQLAFGGYERAKEEVRDTRWLGWLSSLALDVKLGLRMLRKYPMLTVVGGAAIVVATGVGLGASEFVRDLVSPRLPLQEGDRIVRLFQMDTQAGDFRAASLYDLQVWREEVRSLQDLGAFTTMEQGVVTDRGTVGTVSLARMSASGFQLTRIPPLLGRFLIEADEQPDAPSVVVLGYDAWQNLLGGDPDAVGRTVQLAGTPTTVVGVMPEGYGFPQSQNAWTPLRIDPATLSPESASRASMFARLAPGASLESAQAELDVIGRRLATENPVTHERLTPRLDHFASRGSSIVTMAMLSGVRLVFILLLVVISANIAALVFARTVMREGEIAVRASLGATRRRIVLQLFGEALALVGGATLIGLTAAWLAMGPISRLFFTIQQAPQPPFWWEDGLSPSTILYALVLVVVGAVMIGVVPALKATAGNLQVRLGQLSSGGGGGLNFGGMWTVVIVLQVALSVALLPLAISLDDSRAGVMQARASSAADDSVSAVFPADQFLTAQLGRDPNVAPVTLEEREAFLAESQRLFEEVKQRISEDAGVEDVALASGLSAMNHLGVPLQYVDGGAAPPVTGGARILPVDSSYLALMDATVLSGRSLGQADFGPEARAVVVNEAFVQTVLGGRNPVGGQLRFPERDGEAGLVQILPAGSTVNVVGVVRNPGIDAYGPGTHPVVYTPLDVTPVSPQAAGFVGMPQPPVTQLFVRLKPGAEPLGGRLYSIVSGVDPTLRLSDVGTAQDAWGPVHMGARIGSWIFKAIAGVVLMLSVAGIYALMSFTVSRRSREIAIRTAVGAQRTAILASVFGRAILQVLAGVALGGIVAVPVLRDGLVNNGPRSLVLVAVLLIGAGLVACFVPVRRALAVQPAVAMKAD